jgi:DNA (cytosine-5)-methyltransferase 1
MYKVVDLFTGVGGLALGFKNENFKTLLANDVDSDMCEAFKLNSPNVKIICDNIKNIKFKDVVSSKVDIILGGPPCQAYSTSGKRLLEDKRAFLYHQYYRALKELMPKLFIYENVKGLLSMNGGQLFLEIKDLFSSLGYKIQAKILNAADYGVPQLRERVIIVGVLDNIKFNYPQPTHFLSSDTKDLFLDHKKKYLTLEDALSDFPLIGNGEKSEKYAKPPQNDYQKKMRLKSFILTEHNSSTHSESLMRVIRNVPQGGIMKDIPKKFRPKTGFGNSYGRLWWNKPSTTLTRNFGTPSSARCIHPKCDRALTTREGARLQSFNDNFQFYGSKQKKNLQIGNAVPPLLAEALAKQVKIALK